jgi:hypothetical protein
MAVVVKYLITVCNSFHLAFAFPFSPNTKPESSHVVGVRREAVRGLQAILISLVFNVSAVSVGDRSRDEAKIRRWIRW